MVDFSKLVKKEPVEATLSEPEIKKPDVKKEPEFTFKLEPEPPKEPTIQLHDDTTEGSDETITFKGEKAEVVQETSKAEFDMKSYPILILLWGYDGTSKSEQIMKFEPKAKTLILDLEDKLRPLAFKLKFPQKNLITAKTYNKDARSDGALTLNTIRDQINQLKKDILNGKKDINAVALDGISDLRPYAKREWLNENPKRQNPASMGDWAKINDKVKDIVFNLIDLALSCNIHLFLTAQIGKDYEDDNKVIPACKEWIWYNIHHKFRMTRDDDRHKFYAYCEKSFYDPFFTIDLTDFKREKPSLMNMLQDEQILKKYLKEEVVFKQEG